MGSDWENRPSCGCGERSSSALLQEVCGSWSDGETGMVLVSAFREDSQLENDSFSKAVPKNVAWGSLTCQYVIATLKPTAVPTPTLG